MGLEASVAKLINNKSLIPRTSDQRPSYLTITLDFDGSFVAIVSAVARGDVNKANEPNTEKIDIEIIDTTNKKIHFNLSVFYLCDKKQRGCFI